MNRTDRHTDQHDRTHYHNAFTGGNNNNKYSMLAGTHIFQPLAFESHGPQNASATSFIKVFGHRISQRSGDARETQFLFQWLSVISQRFNAVLLGESFFAASDDVNM